VLDTNARGSLGVGSALVRLWGIVQKAGVWPDLEWEREKGVGRWVGGEWEGDVAAGLLGAGSGGNAAGGRGPIDEWRRGNGGDRENASGTPVVQFRWTTTTYHDGNGDMILTTWYLINRY
jgi:hypothetical protein